MNRNLYEYNEYIGYKFISNLKSRVNDRYGGYLIKTNKQGFRNDTDFEADKSGGRRMLVFGNSFTAGDGVSNGKRYTDYLEQHSDYEVYNFGLSGTGTDQQYLIYKHFSKEIEADAIMLTVLVENIRRVNSKYRFYMDLNEEMVCYPKPYYEYKDGNLELQHFPVPNENYMYSELSNEDKSKVDKGGKFYQIGKIVNKLGVKKLAQKILKIQPFPEFNSANGDSWMLLKNILKNWCEEIDKLVYLVPLPTYHYIEDLADPSKYQDRFAELEKEVDVKILDPLPYFKQFDIEERKSYRFEHDPHLTKLGHQRLGEFLSKAVT